MKKNNIFKNKKLFKIFIFVLSAGITVLALFFLVLFITFSIFKDDISQALLLNVNQKINGKISFSDISFTPLKHFPNAAISLSDFELLENKDTLDENSELQILKIKDVYLSVNIIDLLSSRLNVTNVSIDEGSVNLLVYADGTTNISRALMKVVAQKEIIQQPQSETQKKKSRPEQKPSPKKPLDLILSVSDLSIDNISLRVENKITLNKLLLKLNSMNSDFTYNLSKMTANILADTFLDSLIINDKSVLSQKKIVLSTLFEIDIKSTLINFYEGECTYEAANLSFSGSFDLQNKGYLDLKLQGIDDDLSLLTLFLSDEGLRNVQKGKLNFSSTIKGKTVSELPGVNISFGLKDIDLTNPITKRQIKVLNVKGHFSSGDSADWSKAELKIDTLSASLYKGYVKLSGLIQNFKSPYIDLNMNLSGDLTGLEKILKLGNVEYLKGRITINDRVKGKYDPEKKKFLSLFNRGNIAFSDFGISIKNVISFDRVNGTIRRDNDDWIFENLSINYKDTDLLINAKIKNINYLLFDADTGITANVNIKAKIFDLPNFLIFDPYIKRDFPYRIIDGDITAEIKTSTTKLLDFISFPEMDFRIENTSFTIEKFLPRIKMHSGLFKIREDKKTFYLAFENFKTDFLDGKINFSADYSTSYKKPFFITGSLNVSDVSLSELFYDSGEEIPDILNSKLNGSFTTELQFPKDSTLLKFVNISEGNLNYITKTDTIATKNLTLKLNNVYYNKRSKVSPLSSLYINGKMSADLIKSKNLNFDDTELDILAKNGKYEIKSQLVRLFGENAKGEAYLTLNPFDVKPNYRIKYNNVTFRAEKMLQVLNENSIVQGPLNLNLDLTSYGANWDSIVNNVKGNIALSGENLILNGIDADELIKDFKRSQNFNLFDLGAVILAGPVGIAVTKGTDFARILVLNSGQSTKITKLVSNWSIENGTFKIQDAAFTTNINRIAIKGFIGFSDNSLDLTIALLNEYGCGIFFQDISGNMNSPTIGKVKVVGTVLAPVTNLVDDVLGKDCEVFYDGLVEHPIKQKKK